MFDGIFSVFWGLNSYAIFTPLYALCYYVMFSCLGAETYIYSIPHRGD